MSLVPDDDSLARRFSRAIVEHFGPARPADAGEVMLTGCTVVGSHIAGIADPVGRGVLLTQAQWRLRRIVDEITRAEAAKRRDRRGP